MKVLFLDIDGVLNVIPTDRDDFGSIFHSNFVDNLRSIIDETDAKIVISSSWRADGIDKMKSMWVARELPGEVIDVTVNCVQLVNSGDFEFYDQVERGHEIQEWLNRHEVENYVILDDDNDMLQSQRSNFVRCANNDDCDSVEGYGLTKRLCKEAIDILNK